MTKAEARQAMREGHKVTHTYFGKEEYAHLVNGIETFEDGVKIPSDWWDKDWLAEDWSIKTFS